MTAPRSAPERNQPVTGVHAPIRAEAESSRAPVSGQVQTVRYPGALVPFVLERLTKALGAARAAEVMNERLVSWRPRELESPQDLLDFSNHLMRNGGLIQAVGRSLKVQALLRGATE